MVNIQDLEELQNKINKLKTEKIQVERDIEHITTEWKEQGIESIEQAKERQKTLEIEIKKLESREKKLLIRLETEFDWKGL
jgi:chromosome segregation ATPase